MSAGRAWVRRLSHLHSEVPWEDFAGLLDEEAERTLAVAAQRVDGQWYTRVNQNGEEESLQMRYTDLESKVQECISWAESIGKDPGADPELRDALSKLGVQRLAAIRLWTHDGLYSFVTAALRRPDRSRETLRPLLAYLKLLHLGLHSLPESFRVKGAFWRGERRTFSWDEHGVREGGTVTYAAPTSFTTNLHTAMSFAGAKVRTMVRLSYGVGYKLDKISRYGNEGEVLVEGVTLARVVKAEICQEEHSLVREGHLEAGCHYYEAEVTSSVSLLSGSPSHAHVDAVAPDLEATRSDAIEAAKEEPTQSPEDDVVFTSCAQLAVCNHLSTLAAPPLATTAAGILREAQSGVQKGVQVTFTSGRQVVGVVQGGSIADDAVQLVLRTQDGLETVQVARLGGASEFIGVVGGVFGIVLSGLDALACIGDWTAGHQEGHLCEQLEQRLAALRGEYPDSQPGRMAKIRLNTLSSRLRDLKEEIALKHHGTEASRLAGNALGMASSACAIAPVTLGVGALFGAMVGIPAAAIATGVQVGKSWQGFDYRRRRHEIYKECVDVQVRYARATAKQCPNHALLGTPGRFHFKAVGFFPPQYYMTIIYRTHDGLDVGPIYSCDLGQWSHWYEATMEVDPGAVNVVVRFDVRGGASLHRVDRSKEDCPWVEEEDGSSNVEVFFFRFGDGVQAEFELAGTAMEPYVYLAYRVEGKIRVPI